jgi:hypothetical protein
MKAWSVIGLLSTAAILATIPISPEVSPRGVQLSVDQAQAQTYGRYRRVTRRAYRRGGYAAAAPTSPEARVKMCNDMYKGQYRSQGEGIVFQHGYCLSNVAGWAPTGAGPQPAAGPGRGTYYYGAPSAIYGGTGSYGAYAGQPVGGGGGQAYAGGGYYGPPGYYRR